MYITIYNDKGGMGKSTIARELSLYFERLEKKILLVDLDNKRTITKSFEINNEKNISNLLNGQSVLDCITNTKYIDLIAGSKDRVLEFNLSSHLQEIENIYDYIVVDTNEINFTIDSENMVIVPTTPDYYSYINLEDTIKGIKNFENIYVLLNRVEDREEKSEIVVKIYELCEKLNIKLFDTALRDDESIIEVQTKGRELRTYYPLSDIAEDMMDLANELIELTTDEKIYEDVNLEE